MHKKLVNQCAISFSLMPDGPVLIKSGQEGADPTKPDMEFVETYHDGKKEIYLPGSSLKGAIRSQAERIVATLGGDAYDDNNRYQLRAEAPAPNRHYLKYISDSAEIYKRSCFTDQMFGSTHIASRVRIDDAYYDGASEIPLTLEERNSVAIDRLSGAATGTALFNFQVCTSGAFKTNLRLKNFTLAQLGLIGLVLRDLHEGWFSIGFAKSRGLGVMKVKLHHAVIQYPTCQLKDQKIAPFDRKHKPWLSTQVLGAGEFVGKGNDYGFPMPDRQNSTEASEAPTISEMPLGFGVQQCWEGEEQMRSLFELAVQAWKAGVMA